jgi:dipeptidyl-peptidase-3
LNKIKGPLFQPLPNSLGIPSAFAQSTYYLGEKCLKSPDDISSISKLMERLAIFPENTRLKKHITSEGGVTCDTYDILQASVKEDETNLEGSGNLCANKKRIRLIRGDHRDELRRICDSLQSALKYVANSAQHEILLEIRESFLTGDLDTYTSAQKVWVKDKAPHVETVLGFVEPYRDPLGVRAEFEGIVGIADAEQTSVLRKLADMATNFVRKLPWALGCHENDRKGPFEKELFDPPDLSSVHSETTNPPRETPLKKKKKKLAKLTIIQVWLTAQVSFSLELIFQM